MDPWTISVSDPYGIEELKNNSGTTATNVNGQVASGSAGRAGQFDPSTPKGRDNIFKAAMAELVSKGKTVGHTIKFVNLFAAAELDAENNILRTETFLTKAQRDSAMKQDPLLKKISGETEVGSSLSIIYAAAADTLKGYLETIPDTPIGLGRYTEFTSLENMQFTILHEIQHGSGVVEEYDANLKALIEMRK